MRRRSAAPLTESGASEQGTSKNKMDRRLKPKSAFLPACLAAGALYCLAAVFHSYGAGTGCGQRSGSARSGQGGARSEQPQNPPTSGSTSKKTTPQDPEKLGQSLKLSESPTYREAPLTEGGRGGYSSSMSAPEPAPSGSSVEEKAMQELLLESPRWRVGPHGLVEHAGPNGQWTATSSGVEADLNAVSFANRWVGWVVGEKGTVLRTDDGGRTWLRVSSPSREDLLGVRPDDWKSARVISRAGTAYNTSDGGATWSAERQP